tara:strand:+ start:880 stop:1470 length:591 start_codon:yes stop_codon:yes gene_type:complete
MRTKKNRIILTDIDGVVLDWEEAFLTWMEFNGHDANVQQKKFYSIAKAFGLSEEKASMLVRQFNTSASIGYLPPLRDAQYYIKLLHEKYSYKFIAITSLSLDPYAKKLRQRNLKKLFGSAFIELHCLDTGADKDKILAKMGALYPGAYWIEDKIENVDAGIANGLNGLLIEHGFNMNYKGDATVVKSWEEITEIVT